MSTGPIAIELQLLRRLLAPTLELSVGRELMARVVEVQAGGRGTLNLAGMLLEAQLPEETSPGAELRLQVRELTPERVVLAVQPDSAPPVPVAATAVADQPPVVLPGGGRLRVGRRAGGRRVGDGETQVLSLTYDAPHAGPVEMQFVLESGSLQLTLAVAPGQVYEDAQAGSDALASTLAEVAGRPARVTVSERRDPLEVYA